LILMGMKSLIGILIATIMLVACAPVPQYFGPQLAWVPGAPDTAAINSIAFATRAPPPGSPGYLETIKFIDDGVRYIDPYSEFFISFDGEMCFRGLVNNQRAEFQNYQNYWCMPPTAVNNVDAIENNVSYVNEVRLWCRHAAPQCAHRFGQPNFLEETSLIGNSITVQIVPFRQERGAIEHLIYLMGGRVVTG
jgi:hypothetical protein